MFFRNDSPAVGASSLSINHIGLNIFVRFVAFVVNSISVADLLR